MQESPVLQHRGAPTEDQPLRPQNDVDDQLIGEVPFRSWGRYPLYPAKLVPLNWQDDFPRVMQQNAGMPTGALAVGMGRSYGDSCLLKDGNLLVATGMHRLLSFDVESGLLTAEAGLTSTLR